MWTIIINRIPIVMCSIKGVWITLSYLKVSGSPAPYMAEGSSDTLSLKVSRL